MATLLRKYRAPAAVVNLIGALSAMAFLTMGSSALIVSRAT